MIRFLAAAVALFWIFPFHLHSQFYLTGENPASVKWNSIKTEHFKIVYPEKLHRDASQLGKSLEYAMDSASDMKHIFRKRFPVLMQNSSMLSNGFVTLAPFRMELQITPPQELYAQDWITQLALHEFRHVLQLNKLNQGATHVLGWFTGEIAQGILSSRFPPWFYEGDAVYNETRLSLSGRGRSAGFEMPLRTLLIEKEEVYSYSKMIFGSYRDFVPDAYIYGYKMTGYLRQMGDDQVWSDALDRLAHRPYQILPVAFYLKRNFGFFKQGLYDRTMQSLKRLYNHQLDTIKYSNTLKVGPANRNSYTDYLYNLEWNHCIISYRIGLDDAGSFVLADSMGSENVLFRTGRLGSGDMDIKGSTLVWDEIVADPRWQKRNYSVIKTYDLITHAKKTLSKRSRYFSPDFSNDGKHLAVIEIDTENRNYLTLITPESGKVISRYERTDKLLSRPEWVNNNLLAVITTDDLGKQVETLNTQTGEWKIVIPYSFNNLTDLLHYDRFIIFRADHNGIENLFAIDTLSKRTYQVTESRYGARYPSVSTERNLILFSEYSAGGFNISGVEINPDLWPEISPLKVSGANVVQSAVDTTAINEVNTYKEWAHIFRFHSWLPFYTDIDQLMDDPLNLKINPGLMMFSQNLLGTAISSLSYSYMDGYHRFHPSFEWRGWYPVIRVNADIGGPRHILPAPDDIMLTESNNIPVRLNIQTYLPLAFSRGAYTVFLRPEAGFEFIPLLHLQEDNFKKGISLFHFRFSAANYRRMSLRDLYPPVGQNISATVTFQPDRSIYGKLYSLNAGLFLPGFFRHHHFIVTAGFQLQNGSEYPLPYTRVSYPRGFQNLLADRYAAVSLNYALPLTYPDLSIGPLLYIKRFRTTLFYDTGYGENFRFTDIPDGYLHSIGAEILCDFHPIQLIFPLSAGIRVGYKSFENKVFTEFLINIDTNIL